MGNGLTTEEEKTIAAVFAQVPAIERAVLFGSRAMGLARSNSDVDIALYGEKLRLSDILHAASLLEETLLPYQFDLISHASITSPDLLEHIRQYGKEMYRKERNPQEKCSSERYIAGNFQEYELSDLCYYADGRAVVSDLDLDTYISTENMLPNKGGIIRSAGLPTVNQTQAYQVNDVLVSNIRPYFRKIWFADREGGCSNDVLVLRAKETCNPKFLYYLLSENAFFDYATATGKGTKMPRGDKKAIMCYSVPDMPLKYQVEIVATLSSLDEKIENNRKINQCLEQMAQAIFKSWFVDFEPWGGVMPSDWREGTLSEIADITMGQSPAGISYNEEGLGAVFYQGRAEFGFRFPTRRLFTTQPKRMATKGDVLISVRAPVGDLNVAWEPCCIGRGLAAIQSNSSCQSFVLYTMLSLKQQFDVFDGQGTVFGSINKNDMANLPVLIPSDEVLCQFEKLVNPMDAAIEKNYFESCNLLSIRDALLPKLLSGEIRIPEAKKMLRK